jgi:hypothetical protein
MKASDKADKKEAQDGPEDAPEADANALSAQAMEAIHQAIDELASLLRAHAPDAVSALKQAGQAAGDNIGDMAGDARDLGRAKLDDLGAAVRRNPLSWLALAAGLGLVVGLWNGRGGRK